MSEEINISKSLIKKVVTCLNEYINNPYIICGYTKYPSHINVCIQIWNLKNSALGRNICCIDEHVDSETNLDSFKIKVKEKIDKALKQLND